jgi:hypothetical protein
MLLGKLDLEEEIFTGVYSRYRGIGTRYLIVESGNERHRLDPRERVSWSLGKVVGFQIESGLLQVPIWWQCRIRL